MFELKLKKYAQLLVKTGINLKKNQVLVIKSPIECSDFTRLITEIAYENGAKDVAVFWSDEKWSKIRYMMAPEDAFDELPSWQKEFYLSYVKQDAAFLSISASDPDVMQNVNPERMMKAHRSSSQALTEYRDRLMNNVNVWCVASVPTPAWAKKVFSDLSSEEAVAQLWDAIFNAVRVNEEDPVKSWEDHKSALTKNIDILNAHDFEVLHYTSSNGTDLTIRLPENHIWMGGSDFTKEGHEFIANMPTEEIFTAPHRLGVNGIVKSAMPFNLDGNLIDEFELVFKEGRIVDFSAKKGYEQLKSLINTDDGAHYLGEVALVPYDSPISNTKILFYNTLFDENASCHLAIGKAYPVNVKGGENMNSEELMANGVNDSITHEDFMIGTADLSIIGTKKNGEQVVVFKDGNFAL